MFLQDSVVAQQCFSKQTNSNYLLSIYSVTAKSTTRHSSQAAKKLFG